MSIYPVRAKTWWICRKKNPEWMNKDMKVERDLIKYGIKSKRLICLTCKKVIKDWDKCYISHAYAYGFDDAYCDLKCLNSRTKHMGGK